jgi:hypothetical protein
MRGDGAAIDSFLHTHTHTYTHTHIHAYTFTHKRALTQHTHLMMCAGAVPVVPPAACSARIATRGVGAAAPPAT